MADGLTLMATTPDGKPTTFVIYKAEEPMKVGPVEKVFIGGMDFYYVGCFHDDFYC
ncbi:hypothetical protein Pmar_PMAR023341 [Perkinsus marinus ATCC 50983]|uniref:Uncharacterized protein n=1 Tax=Perkinsus marinus (strain ATCC 50983 / TXsc) TaxID=423536 RepID=C5KKA5_PERM5|nr:hypothetical protein Pmar_PMAR023341 [Perkinsus marinus ATCC 50983]EER15017.1 hypothetical protein Pmar_PMAR023341 [Perkinsus marinus ATCC 50983]|eukprot:XP_002783221.1 hypothetical protein Pmar_PMAR023341 [Perkinsus marinus ATCC 50983]